MKRTCLALGIGLVVAAVGACGGDDDDDDDDDVVQIDAAIEYDATPILSDAGTAVLPEDLPSPLPTGAVDIKAVTYNAGLIQLLKFGPERLPFVIDGIKALDADVVCMQEVWLEYTSHHAFAEAVKAEYPYSFWSWTGETAFGNGILMLSKHPMYRGRELFFAGDGSGVDRIVLSADVVTDDSYFHFVCTHLEAFEINIQRSEVAKIAQYIQDQGYDGEPTLLLGDFNTGPVTGCFFGEGGSFDCPYNDTETMCDTEERIEAYNDLLTTWSDAVSGFAAHTQCSYCREFADPLQLITPNSCKNDVRLDGCMYRDFGSSVPTGAQIIFDGLVTYDAAGASQTTQISDHRGVECTFAVP